MKKIGFFSLALVLPLALVLAQSTGQNPTTGSSGQSSTTAPSQSSTATGGTDASGLNKGSTSQTGATGTSNNTSEVGSRSANVSTPPSSQQPMAGASNAYPTDQASTAGNDGLGAQARATGASTGVGVSAKYGTKKGPEIPKTDQQTSTTNSNPHR
jgi:hypothetical protein